MGLASTKQEYFWEACGYGDSETVDRFVKDGIDVNWISSVHNSTPLHVASHLQNNPDIVVILLKAHAKVNATDDIDRIALHHAAMKGHIKIMKTLLNYGSMIDYQDKNGWTPLTEAAYYLKPEAVKLLIEKKCDVNLYNKDFRNPLHEVCRTREKDEDKIEEIVKMLVEAGCDMDKMNTDYAGTDFTPLMFAAYHGHKGAVKALIELKCDINKKGANQWTALHWASDKGHTEVVSMLVEAGADHTLVGTRGENAVDRAKNEEIRTILNDAPTSPDKIYEKPPMTLADLNKAILARSQAIQDIPIVSVPYDMEQNMLPNGYAKAPKKRFTIEINQPPPVPRSSPPPLEDDEEDFFRYADSEERDNGTAVGASYQNTSSHNHSANGSSGKVVKVKKVTKKSQLNGNGHKQTVHQTEEDEYIDEDFLEDFDEGFNIND